MQLTAVIEREGNGYVATCPELDIVSQGKSVEEARLNLVEAVEGFFEVASPSEVKRRLKKETYVMSIGKTRYAQPIVRRTMGQALGLAWPPRRKVDGRAQ